MLNPKGRVVMVSGANRGIGLAVAEHLQGRGHDLSLGMRDPAALGERFGAAALVQAYDAEDRQAAKDWVNATLDRFGRIDALVNNAGIFAASAIDDPEEDEAAIDAMWRVNVKGPLRLMRAAWPALAAAGSGRIVNLASLSGKRVANANVGYALSKHAVMALTHSARLTGWEAGIRASAVCPGFVNTDMAHGVTQEVPSETMTQPEDIAALVATLIALPNSAAVPEVTVNWRYEGVY